jgi:ABC-2 type transport system ATP-binding protein
MIQVRSVSKSFGRVNAVREVSFEVQRGQVVGLLGANGAGKTTTIRVVTGFLPPDSGSVLVEGRDSVTQSEAARRCLGYLPESAPAYGEMAVEDLLDFRARLYGMRRGVRRQAMNRVLGQCDLQGVRRRRVGQLSRGFRQRVGLAAAILHDPPVLVLDEPTSALDPRQIRQIRTLIRELARTKAVLVSSHILPEVEQTCDRVVIMTGGEVRVNARPSELLDSLRQGSPYLLEASARHGDPVPVLAAVPGVLGVDQIQRGAEWTKLRIPAHPGAGDLREALAAALAAHRIPLRELTREAPSLERVFLQLIESEQPGQAAPRSAGAAA